MTARLIRSGLIGVEKTAGSVTFSAAGFPSRLKTFAVLLAVGIAIYLVEIPKKHV